MNSAKFDNVQLVGTAITLRQLQHESAPERDLTLVQRSSADGEVLITERYGNKRIMLRGTLIADSSAELEQRIDEIKELFSRVQKNLDIAYAGSTRRYIATCASHSFDRDYFHINFVPWMAEFMVSSGEGSDLTTTIAQNAFVMDIPDQEYEEASFSFAGSKAPRPVITINGTVITGQSPASQFNTNVKGLEYRNKDTEEAIRITVNAAWFTGTPDDTKKIIIDHELMEVRETMTDGTERQARWTGVFPTYKVGANEIEIKCGEILSTGSIDAVLTDSLQINDTDLYRAQSFMVPYTDSTFRKALIGIFKEIGSPGTVTVRIETDNNGAPSGSLVDANATDTISAGTIASGSPTSYTMAEAEFPGLFTLEANTRYWLIVLAAGVDGSNVYALPTGDTIYLSGNRARSSNAGSTWVTDEEGSMVFKILNGGLSGQCVVRHTVEYVKKYL
jgi:hypothetical protein